MAKKDTNPKDKLGVRKAPMHCVPCGVMMELGLAMMEGGRKYGTHNYRSMGVSAAVYYDAAQRHLMDWWEGEDIDPDSGLSHVTKAIACLAVLRDSMLMLNWEDDRPIRHPLGLNIQRLNGRAAEIVDKYPLCKEPYTEIGEKQNEETDDCIANRGWGAKFVCLCAKCKSERGDDVVSQVRESADRIAENSEAGRDDNNADGTTGD
jgi:hypothetical protein